jgi:TolA-binding protein
MEWESGETDAKSILPEAQKSIDAGSYMEALEKLEKAEMPSDQALSFELLFREGFCYYQLEDYSDAAKNLSDAYVRLGSSRTAVGTPGQRGSLLFQLGSSYFFLGREKEAVTVLRAYLSDNDNGPFAPYASLLLARCLVASGDTSRARSIAIVGMKKYKGTDLESEFASLLK